MNIATLVDAVIELMGFFEGDERKVVIWLTTPNPMFGGTAPSDLIKANRGHKVYAFMKEALEGNLP